MFDDKTMDAIMKRCKEDPEYMEIFRMFMELSQKAAIIGMSVNEMANICMMGYAIGEDPSLQEMILNMDKITKMGLDIKDK